MTPQALSALIDASWPPEAMAQIDGWTIRNGGGAGSRVSAATASGPSGEIPAAESAMRELGQTPLFMVRSGEDALDAALAATGYTVKNPTTFHAAPIAQIATQRPPPVTCFEVWPPLATQVEIWTDGGIDAARLAVMHRVAAPKTTVLGRLNDTPAGTAFAAFHDGIVMIHAIETAEPFRREGLARHMFRALAFWGQSQGAHTIGLLVTSANLGANALYTSLGMTPVGGYHYRIHPKATT